MEGIQMGLPRGVGSTSGSVVLGTDCAAGTGRTVGLRSVVRKSSVASGRGGEIVFDDGDNLALALLGGTLGEGLPEEGDAWWWVGEGIIVRGAEYGLSL